MISNIKKYCISLLRRRFSRDSSKFYCHELLNSLEIPLTNELTKEQIDEIFDGYGSHFIVQEKQSQHSALSKLNESSLNTIRVITYWRVCGEIVPLYTIQRIGMKGKTTDNVGSGGINVKINWYGRLDQYASVGQMWKEN